MNTRHNFKSAHKVKYSIVNSKELIMCITANRILCKLVHITYMQCEQIHLPKTLHKDMDTNDDFKRTMSSLCIMSTHTKRTEGDAKFIKLTTQNYRPT
jgi:hypothetical protein